MIKGPEQSPRSSLSCSGSSVWGAALAPDRMLVEVWGPASLLSARPPAASELHFCSCSPEETRCTRCFPSLLLLCAPWVQVSVCSHSTSSASDAPSSPVCLSAALVAMAAQLIQEDLTLTRTVGGKVSFSCGGTDQCYDNIVFWYQKRDTGTFTLILDINKRSGSIDKSYNHPQKDDFTAVKKEYGCDLEIQKVDLTHSASYYCACFIHSEQSFLQPEQKPSEEQEAFDKDLKPHLRWTFLLQLSHKHDSWFIPLYSYEPQRFLQFVVASFRKNKNETS